MPLVSCDYLYLTASGVFAHDELTDEERNGALRMIAALCGATESQFAHAAPRKGADSDGYIVEQLLQDVLWRGHHRVMVRSDNEPALLQVVNRTMAALKIKGVDATSEGSVPYHPQTNGAAENAVKLLKGTLKANLLSLERQIQARIPLDHTVVTWLVTFSANVYTSRVRGRDGKAAQQQVRSTTHPDKLGARACG